MDTHVNAAGMYYDRSKQKNTSSPGNSYRLPRCCVEALQSSTNRGRLAVALGVTIASLDIYEKSKNPTTIITFDPKVEAEMHVGLWEGIKNIMKLSEFEVIQKHYRKHSGDNGSDAQKFWTRVYYKKRSRLPPKYRQLNETFDGINEGVGRGSSSGTVSGSSADTVGSSSPSGSGGPTLHRD